MKTTMMNNLPDDDVTKLQTDTEEDGTPVLDEEDLEENNLSVEEADNVEWDDAKSKGSSGAEEKDITV